MSTVPNSMMTDDGEVAIHPRPAGSILPGSEGTIPQEPPPGTEFPISPLQGGPEPAPVRVPGQKGKRPAEAETPVSPEGTLKTLRDGTQILTKPDGSTYLKLGDQFVPYVTPDSKDATKKAKIPTKDLGDFMSKLPRK